jgi:hypothetical protein
MTDLPNRKDALEVRLEQRSRMIITVGDGRLEVYSRDQVNGVVLVFLSDYNCKSIHS